MALIALELENIRVYARTRINPSQHLNLICGSNASGKTTLLEAIHLLGTGRSFRTKNIEQLRRIGSETLGVLGQLRQNSGETTRLGLTHNEQGRRLSVNGLPQSQVSSLAQHLPLQIISPDSHFEFQNNAKYRRAMLDWGLFHVEPEFQGHWLRFQRLLQQRNAALKAHTQSKAQQVWDTELIEAGETLHQYRTEQLDRLAPFFQTCCRELFGPRQRIRLNYESGWPSGRSYAESLHQDRGRDRARGYTHSGPQRSDLLIFLNDQDSRHIASHGQNKMLVIALRLAQVRNLIAAHKHPGSLLIDDLAAELDAEHRRQLTSLLAGLPLQVFITSTDAGLIDTESWLSHRRFHVEQGQIQAVA